MRGIYSAKQYARSAIIAFLPILLLLVAGEAAGRQHYKTFRLFIGDHHHIYYGKR